jgi:hypothetical protein
MLCCFGPGPGLNRRCGRRNAPFRPPRRRARPSRASPSRTMAPRLLPSRGYGGCSRCHRRHGCRWSRCCKRLPPQRRTRRPPLPSGDKAVSIGPPVRASYRLRLPQLGDLLCAVPDLGWHVVRVLAQRRRGQPDARRCLQRSGWFTIHCVAVGRLPSTTISRAFICGCAIPLQTQHGPRWRPRQRTFTHSSRVFDDDLSQRLIQLLVAASVHKRRPATSALTCSKGSAK